MSNDNPFQSLFETLGRLPAAHAESVNRQAYDVLYDLLSEPVEKAGRCILLRSPRAGHGKTHLLSRIEHQMGASHEFIPLRASFGCLINAATAMDDTLRGLLRPLPASGGLRVLDRVVRRLFAQALEPMVISGEVPCQDRDGALTALRARPMETFDFHHPNAITARWVKENMEALGPRLSMEIAQRSSQPLREVAFWVDTWSRFALVPLENSMRLRILADAIRSGNPSEGMQMDRLQALLGILTQLMRVVLVADDLEGISADETAALRLAAFLASLRQSVERLDVILSLNIDVWERAFIPCLSGGMVDRLSEVVIELHPLTEEEMVALLESRVPGLGSKVLERLDRTTAGVHARGLIRAAGVAWLRASAMDSQISVAQTTPPVPTAVPVPIAAIPAAPSADFQQAEEPQQVPPPTTPVSLSLPSHSLPENTLRQNEDVTTPLPVALGKPNEWRPLLHSATTTTLPETQPAVQVVGGLQIAEPPEVLEGFTAPVFQPAPEAPAIPTSQTPVTPEETEKADPDRVDKLLQQFRERYGRGSQ